MAVIVVTNVVAKSMSVPDSSLSSMCCSLTASLCLTSFDPDLDDNFENFSSFQFFILATHLLPPSKLPKVFLKALKEDVLGGLLPIPELEEGLLVESGHLQQT